MTMPECHEAEARRSMWPTGHTLRNRVKRGVEMAGRGRPKQTDRGVAPGPHPKQSDSFVAQGPQSYSLNRPRT
jgi:hypothetical protein